MKSIMISIQPKWCEKILNGEKTIEVRKSKPKIDTPFTCHIYCTKGDALALPCLNAPRFTIHQTWNGTPEGRQMTAEEQERSEYALANGKVIGEFTCNEVTFLGNVATDSWALLAGDAHDYKKRLVTERGCLTEEEILNYGGKYAWHISDLVIYDKPKKLKALNEFCSSNGPLTRAPQSWCYVRKEEKA